MALSQIRIEQDAIKRHEKRIKKWLDKIGNTLSRQKEHSNE